MTNYFDAMASMLAGDPPPWKIRPSRPASAPPSVNSARHEALGVRASTGCIAYYEWRELHDTLSEGESVLAEVVAERTDPTISAIAWLDKAPAGVVADVLADAAGRAPGILATDAPPTLRLWVAPSKPGTYKRRNVLVGALDAAATAQGAPMIETAHTAVSALDDLADVGDWDLLARLDDMAQRHPHEELTPAASALLDLWNLPAKKSPFGTWRMGHLLTYLDRGSTDLTDDALATRAAESHREAEHLAIVEDGQRQLDASETAQDAQSPAP